MRYIKFTDQFGWNHDPYWEYLAQIRDQMPDDIFNFASDTENHDLESPNSLHDAWLEWIKIGEESHPSNRKLRTIVVDARYLGPRHDRYIHMRYNGVSEYRFTNLSGSGDNRGTAPHGDLLVHEVTMVADGLFSHELVFSMGATFLVIFNSLEHRIDAFD